MSTFSAMIGSALRKTFREGSFEIAVVTTDEIVWSDVVNFGWLESMLETSKDRLPTHRVNSHCRKRFLLAWHHSSLSIAPVD